MLETTERVSFPSAQSSEEEVSKCDRAAKEMTGTIALGRYLLLLMLLSPGARF